MMRIALRHILRALVVAGVVVGMLGMLPEVRPAASGASEPVQLHLKIVTVKVPGQKDPWPKYEPSTFTLPPHTLVQVTLRDFDDGPDPAPPGYNVVRGTVGGVMRVVKGASADPRGGTLVKQWPAKDIAHTFSVVGAGFFVNIPVPPLATVVFSFKTPGPGSYPWHCYTTCGTGPSGWGGPMATPGWMSGRMVVR